MLRVQESHVFASCLPFSRFFSVVFLLRALGSSWSPRGPKKILGSNVKGPGISMFLLFRLLGFPYCISFGNFGEVVEQMGVKRGVRKSCAR